MGETRGPDPIAVESDSEEQAGNSTVRKPRRRFLRVVRWICVALLAIVVGAVSISTINHRWQTPRDKQAIEQLIGPSHRYVDVDGHRMSVAVQGSGPRTIVLMPGMGTPEPILDFAPLARRLAEANTVVTVENFGLGLSDGTDAPRTSEAIVDETRSALSALGLNGPYVLMPHSISGLYAMWWATNHPGEVAAVVGLDDERYTSELAEGLPEWPGWMSTVTALGGVRDLIFLDMHTDYLGLAADYRESLEDAGEYTPEQQELYLRSYSWVLNSTMLAETAHEAENVRGAEGATFPPTMPAMSILASSSLTADPEWESSHHAAITNPSIQQVEIMDGHHYLFHAHASEIAEMTQRFLDENVPLR
ncbi:alpha/beta hydrolase [Rhodococcus sp. KBS0724]|uniref:alpha/beta fold hydrolase n=1 Tax=Rhodococcus sp. KBS0724 TaxID=1179674 RepID=UPI00110E4705|nr:alpha/beta hydrolase [Rhodococcus sp. KBS0724]TSD47082.1 alpha/beta hydrolase [Rhodococcus sp. KBS0724]